MLVTSASIRAKKFSGISSICWPARSLANLKIAACIERDKSSACKACGLVSAKSAVSKAAILSAKFACAVASAAALVSAIPASRPAIMPSALPRSNAAVTVSKLAAICAPFAVSPSLASAIGLYSAASSARPSLASTGLAGLPLKSEDRSPDPISGAISFVLPFPVSSVTFGAASLIGDGGLLGGAACPSTSFAPSAAIKAPSTSLPIAES